MKDQKIKLWMGIGVATILSSSGAMAGEGGESGHDEMMKSSHYDGGEGGEHHGGEAGEEKSRHHDEGGEGGEGGENHADEGGEGGENHGGEGGEHHGGEGGEMGEAFLYFPTDNGGGEGGEGGESGSQQASAVRSDGVYIAMIEMMQGHMMAARDLIRSGDVADGRPHLTHPWVEIYPALEDGLRARGQSDLAKSLKALSETAGRTNQWSDVEADFEKAWRATERAMAAASGDDAQAPATVARVVLSLTKQAVLEYDGAIDDGAFVAIHEYQDGRGFVLAAEEYLTRHKARLQASNKEAWRHAMTAFDELKQVWPAFAAPETPVVAVPNAYAAQARLELALSPYLYQ